MPVLNLKKPSANRAISNFSHLHYCGASILTINGTGFGTVADTVFSLGLRPTYLAFTLPKSNLVSWSATQIKVQVPDDAGTARLC